MGNSVSSKLRLTRVIVLVGKGEEMVDFAGTTRSLAAPANLPDGILVAMGILRPAVHFCEFSLFTEASAVGEKARGYIRLSVAFAAITAIRAAVVEASYRARSPPRIIGPPN